MKAAFYILWVIRYTACMVTKNQKQDTIAELKEKFSKAKAVFTTTQLGLTVEEITKLRKAIRPQQAEFKIAKNTLFKKASEGTAFEAMTGDLKGPTAFLFCYDDPISPAGSVKKFSKENKDKVAFEGAYFDGEVLDKEAANKVAGLPSRETLLAQIAGMLVQNTQSIAYILSQLAENPDQAKSLKDLIVASASTVETASTSDETTTEQ